MQTKLHQWAVSDLDHRFDDLFNLVYDPAVLVVAWRRVRGNKGKRSGGVDGVAPVDVTDVAELLTALRDDLKAQQFGPLPAGADDPESRWEIAPVGDRDRAGIFGDQRLIEGYVEELKPRNAGPPARSRLDVVVQLELFRASWLLSVDAEGQ